MSDHLKTTLRLVLPLAVAALFVHSEGLIRDFVYGRPGVLPVALVTVLAGLVIPQARHWLIVSLCYAIALMALRDCLQLAPPPAQIDFPGVSTAYRVGWGLLVIVAGVAAVVEALHPNSVWSRRCYFAAAALYFGGHGFTAFLRRPSWEAIVLGATGLVATAGILFADSSIWPGAEDREEDEDAAAHRERLARRQETIAAREWHDDREGAAGRR